MMRELATITMSWDALNANLSHMLRTADGNLPLTREITAALRNATPAVGQWQPVEDEWETDTMRYNVTNADTDAMRLALQWAADAPQYERRTVAVNRTPEPGSPFEPLNMVWSVRFFRLDTEVGGAYDDILSRAIIKAMQENRLKLRQPDS